MSKMKRHRSSAIYAFGIWRSEAILMHACDQHKLANQILISGLVRFLHASFLFLFFESLR
jgi:hypothetical protein